jgi:prephenate dehydrogenase
MGKDFLSLAGPGFRDFTRIAAADPTLWRDVMLSNREELLNQSKDVPAQPAVAGTDDLQRQCRRPARADRKRQRDPCELEHGAQQK